VKNGIIQAKEVVVFWAEKR